MIEFSISSSLFWNKFNPLFITIFAVMGFNKFCKAVNLSLIHVHIRLTLFCCRLVWIGTVKFDWLFCRSIYSSQSTRWYVLLHDDYALFDIFFIENWRLRMTPFFFVCGVAVFRWIWIPRDIVWADISMLPCFIYWKGWIFFSLPFASISVHWYDFELVRKRMAVYTNWHFPDLWIARL